MSQRTPDHKLLAVLDRLANGETLTRICTDPDMPSARTVRELRAKSALGKSDLAINGKPFHELYDQARIDQVDTYADWIIDETDLTLKGDKGDGALVQLTRLKIDAKKWIAERLRPQTYGNKIVHAGDDTQPIKIEVVDFSKVSVTETK